MRRSLLQLAIWAVWAILVPVPLIALPDQVGDLDEDGKATIVDLVILIAYLNGEIVLPANVSPYSDIDGDGFVSQGDITALTEKILERSSLESLPLSYIRKASPTDGEGGVSNSRETIFRFSIPLAEGTTISQEQLFAEFAGEKLTGRIVVSADGRTVTLFYDENLPASSRVNVTFVGDGIEDFSGRVIDLDGDGEEGGTFSMTFDTLGLTVVPGTHICGRVFASSLQVADGGNAFVNEPLEGVTVYVDGLEEEIFAITDQNGDFRLEDAPSGRFFVHIDGRTADADIPEGAYYPSVGKAWVSVPGEEVTIGEIYLPLIPADTLKPLSMTETTEVRFSDEFIADNPKFAGVSLMVAPESLFFDDGTLGEMVGLAPVNPDRLPGRLPLGLGIDDVVTIQTDGATNFDVPAPVCLPNLEGFEPGEQSALWSFNHDTGRFEIVGSMTVSADGKSICSDPGVGILAPGWHGTAPGTQGGGGEVGDGGGDDDEEKGTADTPPGAPTRERTICPTDPDATVDPVYYFSGEFYESVEDIRVAGRGLDFVWSRKYRSKIGNSSANGNSWDCSYNIFLEKNGEDMILCDGNSRADKYFKQGAENRWRRREFFREIAINAENELEVVFEDTGRWVFHPFDGSPEEGKIAASIDRNGEGLSFEYDENGRLSKITDSLDRDYFLTYNVNGFLIAITDFADRSVAYEYFDGIEEGGNFGDLKSVTYPAVTDTPNGNNFPNGKTVTYTYTTGFSDERLNHNLLTITDGRRNDPSDETVGGGSYLVNVYSQVANPNHPDFDRIVTQYWGGDRIDLVYNPIMATIENGGATMQTIINDRVGNVLEYTFDDRNRTILKREYTGRADPASPTTLSKNRPKGKLRLSDPAYFESRYQWNEDSQMVLEVLPNGNTTENIYESELNPTANPRSRGNLRIVRRSRGAHGIETDQEVVEEFFEYDSNFGNGCCGRDFVRRYTDGNGYVTLYDYDDSGNLIKTSQPDLGIVTEYEYNEFGQETAMIWPASGDDSRRRDEFEYYETGIQKGFQSKKIEDVGGQELITLFSYDSRGNLIQAVDPRGDVEDYIVNELDQVVRRIAPDIGGETEVRFVTDFWYDANDNIVRIDDENRNADGSMAENARISTLFSYEILNHLTRKSEEVDADTQIVQEYEYDGNRNSTLTRWGEAVNGNQPTNLTRIVFDERNLPYQRIHGFGGDDQSVDEYHYDGNGNLVLQLRGEGDAEPSVTRNEFDGFDRLVRRIDGMGNVQERHFDANDNLVLERFFGELVDVEGGEENTLLREYTYGWDEYGRIIRSERKHFDPATGSNIGDGKSIMSLEYFPNSMTRGVTNDLGHSVSMTYDSMNRLQETTDPAGNTIAYIYDPNGNILNVTEVQLSDLGGDPVELVTQYTYDSLNRLVRVVDSDGNLRDHQYDSRDNLTAVSDGRRSAVDSPGNQILHTYDGFNRRVSTHRVNTDTGIGSGAQVSESVLSWHYDDDSRLVAETDPNGNVTRYEYDSLDRLMRVVYPDGSSRSSSYDSRFNLVEATDPNGNTVSYIHDFLNRLVSVDVEPGAGVSSDTTEETYIFDGLSRLVRVEDDDSIVVRKIDSLSNILRDEINGKAVLATSDGEGNRLQTILPGGRTIDYAYDSLGRISSIVDGEDSIAEYSYAGVNRIERVELGNGIRKTFGFDDSQRVTRLSHRRSPFGSGDAIVDYQFEWDEEDNRVLRESLLPDGASQAFQYDSLNRLVKSILTPASGETVVVDYSLDDAGNRTSVTGGTGGGSYTLNPEAPNPADASVNQYTSTPYDGRTYDANGNLVEVDLGGAKRKFSYDYRNRLIRVSDEADVEIASYGYDSLDRRIRRTVGGVETNYYYVGWKMVEEQNLEGATVATYVHGTMIDDVVSMTRDETDYFLHSDDQFNVLAVTDLSGAVVERYDYDDYGEPTVMSPVGEVRAVSTIGNTLLYGTQVFDSETGLYYFRKRYLDPQIGRFISRDPSGIWGDLENLGNGYTYAGSNPWSARDYLGELTIKLGIGGGGGAGVGGGASGGIIIQFGGEGSEIFDIGLYGSAQAGLHVGVNGGASGEAEAAFGTIEEAAGDSTSFGGTVEVIGAEYSEGDGDGRDAVKITLGLEPGTPEGHVYRTKTVVSKTLGDAVQTFFYDVFFKPEDDWRKRSQQRREAARLRKERLARERAERNRIRREKCKKQRVQQPAQPTQAELDAKAWAERVTSGGPRKKTNGHISVTRGTRSGHTSIGRSSRSRKGSSARGSSGRSGNSRGTSRRNASRHAVTTRSSG